MKTRSLGLVLSVFILSGCSLDQEVMAFTQEADDVATGIVRALESESDLNAGIAKAQTFLDSRKAQLQAKYNTIKGARGFQIKRENRIKLQTTLMKVTQRVVMLRANYLRKTVSQPDADAGIKKLGDDFTAIVTGA